MELLNEEPSVDSFVPLSEHQSQTPGSFFGGKPVLHLRSPAASLVIPKKGIDDNPAFAKLLRQPSDHSTNGPNGVSSEIDPSELVTVPDIDVWVTSENLILFSSVTKAGVAIPYPTISLHAIQRLRLPQQASHQPGSDLGAEVRGLYTQLVLPSKDPAAAANDEEPDTLEFTIVPSSSATDSSNLVSSNTAPPRNQVPSQEAPLASDAGNLATTSEVESEVTEADDHSRSPIQALFAAVSACTALHPDPALPGDEEEEDPGGMPGAGGWITAENAEQYFDADGQFIGGSSGLGAGAGTVRTWEEAEAGADDVGDREGEDDARPQREGQGDGEGEGDDSGETKWRRTG